MAGARRVRRASTVDWFDRLYRAYLTVIAAVLGLAYVTALVGDSPVGSDVVRWIDDFGWAPVGVLCGLVVFAGARSGLNGGPLTLEEPFVRHVLLSPAPRREALRTVVGSMLARSLVIGAAVGAGAGVVASERLRNPFIGLAAGGAFAGAMTGCCAVAAAFVMSATRARRVLSTLVAAPVAAVAGVLLGRAAMAGVSPDPAAVGVAGVLGVVAVLAGARFGPYLSIEAAQRRAGLIGGLRLAVTRQDLRAVTLLHRRLTLGGARSTPWLRAPTVPSPVLTRSLQGLFRMPAARLARLMVVIAVASGAAVIASRDNHFVWIVVVAAVHVAAVDLNESLAQEIDHPSRWAQHPGRPGRHLVRHLLGPALVLAVPLIAGSAAARSIAPITLAATALPGSAWSIAMPPFDLARLNPFAPPESVGFMMLVRFAWPVGVTALGLAPLWIGRPGVLLALAGTAGATWALTRITPS